MKMNALSCKPLLLLVASCFSLMAFGAGNVQFASGDVSAVNTKGEKRSLSKGAPINQGDTISTGSDARAQIRFSDGALVSLQPQTQFRVDGFKYDGKTDGSEKGFFSLLRGGMRTITGLIGRFNRENYKINTPVATIGIRGTEYTAVLDPANENLAVNTGEGLVEVCNAAGCILLASGESGIVSGQAKPKHSNNKPLLPPTPILAEATAPVFSTAENRVDSGAIAPISSPLTSGSDYSAAIVGWSVSGSSTFINYDSGTTATFGSASKLQSLSDLSPPQSATNIAGSFSMDGVIGWGRWATGEASLGSVTKDIHYVVGKETPYSEIANLGGLVATYRMVGYTLPTATDGTIGQAPSGTLVANFSLFQVNININVPIGGNVHNISASPSLYYTSLFNANPPNTEVKGFFAGTNASHAGLTYKITGTPNGDVTGAAVFKR